MGADQSSPDEQYSDADGVDMPKPLFQDADGVDMPKARFQAANAYGQSDGSFTIKSSKYGYPDIPVKTLHLSCSSDAFSSSKRFGGVVIYSYNGMTDWVLHGKHCKSGYMVVLDTDSSRVKSAQSQSPGQVHGAVYRAVFGENPSANTIGEGFAFYGGEFHWNSGVFNTGSGSRPYHDGLRNISDQAKKAVSRALHSWRHCGIVSNSLPSSRNYTINTRRGECKCSYDQISSSEYCPGS